MNRCLGRLVVCAMCAVALLTVVSGVDAQGLDRHTIEAIPTLEAHPNCPSNSNTTAINERGDVVGCDSLMLRTNVLIRSIDQKSMDGGMR